MITNLLPETNSPASSLDDMESPSPLSITTSNNPKAVQDVLNNNEQDTLNGTQLKCDKQLSTITKSLTLNVNDLIACNDPKTMCNMDNRKAGGYLIAVHRKLSRQDTYFLSYHKTRPSLFGVPLLIPCYEDGTNKDLYCAVWIQVARLLSPLPSTPPDQANHATDW